MPKQDFYISYKGKKYSVQIKAVRSSNEGKNEMNATIRNGVDLAIAVVYDIDGSGNVIIKAVQIYVPDAEGTYDYISAKKVGKRKLRLDKSQSFMQLIPSISGGRVIPAHRQA